MSFRPEQIPEDPDNLPPARRRRARRLLAPLDADERAEFLADLAHRASPSFDFFLFSLLAGIVMSAGLVLDSTPLLVLGAIFAPLMAPIVGIALGTVTGSVPFFLRSLVGLMIGAILVLLAGIAAGYISQTWLLVEDLTHAQAHARLSWADFLLLAAGAIMTAAFLANSGRTSGVASVALAYELFVPLAAAGIGLGSGAPHLWPDGVVLFSIHLAWAALLGALTLAILGYRPLTLFGYTFGAAVALTGVILVIGLGGAGAVFGAQVAIPTPVPTATNTLAPTLTPSLTPVPPTATLTPSLTPTITPVPPSATPSLTPEPTPVLALVRAQTGGGAVIRSEPGGEITGLVANGTLMEVYPEMEQIGNVFWVYVVAPDGQEGWMVQSLLVTATPAPDW